MILLIGLSIIIIDQLSKLFVTIRVPYGTSFGGLVKISNIANTGMAYGMRSK